MNPFIVPKAGEEILVNKPYLIQWFPTSPGPVFLELSYSNNVNLINITVSTPNTGNYSWTPLDIFAGRNNYYLGICDVNLPQKQKSCSYTNNGRFALESVSSSTLQSTTTTGTATHQTLSTSASSLIQTPTQTPNPGLSTGAKAAIGVVVPVFVLAVVGLAVFFIWRRRKGTAQTQRTNSGAEPMGEYYKAELPIEGHSKKPVMIPSELESHPPGSSLYELH